MNSRHFSLFNRWFFLLGLLVLPVSALAADLTLPAGQALIAYTPYTITTNPAAAPGTIYGATGLPSGMSINASSGTISGTPLSSGVFTGTLSLNDGVVINNFTYSLTIAAALGTPEITSSLTALGGVGEPFATNLSASNAPTSFNVGALPSGLTYDSAQTRISGTPLSAGTFNVSLSANNASGTGASVTLVITIVPSGPIPVITSAASRSGDLNVAFSYQIAASNDPTAFTANGLPVGLSLNTSTGLISGTPDVAGITAVTLTASNGNGTSAPFTLTLTLGPVATITSASTLAGYTGVAIAPFTITASNAPLSFNVGTLPTGLSFNSTTQQITGTPSAVASTPVTLSAINATGAGPAFTLTIAITAPTLPVISSHPLAQTKNVGESVTFSVVASGAPVPTYQWRKAGNDISGATLSSYTINSLVQADAGNYSVNVTNAAGSALSNIAGLTVNASGFASYQQTHFTAGELMDANVSGPLVILTADGLSNLLKYALGLAPKATATTGLPQNSVVGNDWVYTYQRPADRSDLTYAVEVSTNLTTWTMTGVTHELVSSLDGVESWRARVPLSTGANVFFRLKVTR
ncbi:MAG: putative Ig domain-containing protein [Candidatus Didemnitutus sp.]|nr:putative Ig domain-containing protein [Candidatus Didemnitutus sp.]